MGLIIIIKEVYQAKCSRPVCDEGLAKDVALQAGIPYRGPVPYGKCSVCQESNCICRGLASCYLAASAQIGLLLLLKSHLCLNFAQLNSTLK